VSSWLSLPPIVFIAVLGKFQTQKRPEQGA